MFGPSLPLESLTYLQVLPLWARQWNTMPGLCSGQSVWVGFFILLLFVLPLSVITSLSEMGGGGGLSLSQCLEPCETLDNFLTGKLNTPAFSVWDSCFILSLAQTLLGQFSVGNKKRLKSDQARHEVWSFYTTHNDVLSSFYSLQQFACRAQNAL